MCCRRDGRPRNRLLSEDLIRSVAFRGIAGMIRDPEVGRHVTNVMTESAKRLQPFRRAPVFGAPDIIGRCKERLEDVPADTDAYRDLGVGEDLGKLVPEQDDRNIEVPLP